MAEKSKQKLETVAYITPWVIARYPKISKPDTQGKFADNKFKTDALFMNEADYKAALAAAQAAAKKLWPSIDQELVQLPIKEFFDGKDEEKTSAGMGLVLKSKFRPAVFDAKKKKLPDGVAIGGGSEIRVASAFFPWSKASEEVIVENGKRRKEKVTAYGISLRLGDVQVRKLEQNQGQGDGSAFDEVEGGFEYDVADAGGEQFTDDATDL